MRIAVASGKGGTGKTTVAVSLLLSLAALPDVDRPSKLQFLDCDVEEPNAAIFFKPAIEGRREVGIQLPQVDPEICTHCGRCAEVCAFHAIAVFGEKVLIFPQLCHGCGSCAHNCPVGAISEIDNPTGSISWGTVPGTSHARFGQGEMHVGEAMANPIIRKLKRRMADDAAGSVTILDAPPGNACPVVETLRNAGFVILVTEPTPFGLHDLRGAVQVARGELGLPIGVVINRVGVGDDGVRSFCDAEGIPVLLTIPLDRRIAEAYADGMVLVDALPEYRERFVALFRRILSLVEAVP